jgi:hypothetical protein
MPTTTPFPRALLLGAVAGMRSQLPIALLGLERYRGRFSDEPIFRVSIVGGLRDAPAMRFPFGTAYEDVPLAVGLVGPQ